MKNHNALFIEKLKYGRWLGTTLVFEKIPHPGQTFRFKEKFATMKYSVLSVKGTSFDKEKNQLQDEEIDALAKMFMLALPGLEYYIDFRSAKNTIADEMVFTKVIKISEIA